MAMESQAEALNQLTTDHLEGKVTPIVYFYTSSVKILHSFQLAFVRVNRLEIRNRCHMWIDDETELNCS